jgi:hypothetical protein
MFANLLFFYGFAILDAVTRGFRDDSEKTGQAAFDAG